MKKVYSFSIFILVGLGLLCGGFVIGKYAAFNASSNVSQASLNGYVNSGVVLPLPTQLPDNIFDAHVAIQDSTVRFSYPNKGFYGFGAEVIREEPYLPYAGEAPAQEMNQVSVYSTKNHGQEGGPLNRLVVLATQKNGNETINDVISRQPKGIQKRGVLVRVNGHDFFVYKLPYSLSAGGWSAVAVGAKEVVSVNLTFNPGNDSLSYAAYTDSDRLFFEVLSHVTFE